MTEYREGYHRMQLPRNRKRSPDERRWELAGQNGDHDPTMLTVRRVPRVSSVSSPRRARGETSVCPRVSPPALPRLGTPLPPISPGPVPGTPPCYSPVQSPSLGPRVRIQSP